MSLGLATAGARVAVAAKSEDAGDLARLFSESGFELFYIPADLSDPAQRACLVAKVTEHYGKLDILVNNAGHQHRAPILEYGAEQWGHDLEVMLTAVFDLSQQAARVMKVQGGGKIIQIASISSFQGARGIVGYSTAKHGLVGLTKCLANELAGLGINVNAIAPGLFETEMAVHVLTNIDQSRELKGRIPAGRFGKPDDVVGPLIFLASDASRHVHGHVLLVDGGWMGR
jgi:2-dehydro-3-deoxy-D-gluconate 5-dehydrogenase